MIVFGAEWKVGFSGVAFEEIEYGARMDVEIVMRGQHVGDLLVGVTLLSETTD